MSQVVEQVSVECYSGALYAERPAALTWHGARLAVELVERAWRTQDGLAFDVRTADGRRFDLTYDLSTDQWFARPLNL